MHDQLIPIHECLYIHTHGHALTCMRTYTVYAQMAVYKTALDDSSVLDVSVEDPSEDFQVQLTHASMYSRMHVCVLCRI